MNDTNLQHGAAVRLLDVLSKTPRYGTVLICPEYPAREDAVAVRFLHTGIGYYKFEQLEAVDWESRVRSELVEIINTRDPRKLLELAACVYRDRLGSDYNGPSTEELARLHKALRDKYGLKLEMPKVDSTWGMGSYEPVGGL